MTLAEYYNFPEGTNVSMLIIPSFFDTVEPNFPAPADMSYAFAYYKGTSVPVIDVSNVTTMNNMFNYCFNLTSVDLSNWDTSNVTDMSYMFVNCKKLTSVDLSNWDTSNVHNMSSMFQGCNNLTSLDSIKDWDTSKVTSMNTMFSDCAKLETIPALRADKLSSAMLFGYSGLSNLKNFGGLIGLKVSATSYFINNCPNLTYESCINVLNGLYDFTGNGETPISSPELKVHANFLTAVGDEISIGTNKGWTITA